MTSIFAPPELLTLYSCGIDPSDQEGPLARGTHLRIFAGLGSSFPLAPFVVFPAPIQREQVTMTYVDPPGEPGSWPTGGSTAFATFSYVDDDYERTVDIHLEPQDGSVTAAVLDAQGHELAYCDRYPFELVAGLSNIVRLDGALDGLSVLRAAVNVDTLLGLRPDQALAQLDLPVADLLGGGAPSWYVGGCDHWTAMDRATNGAPLAVNPMDDPTGSFDWPGPGPAERAEQAAQAERERVATLLDNGGRAGVRSLLAGLVGDGEFPWRQVEEFDMTDGTAPVGARTQRALLPRLSALQLAAIDPGIARYLGFAHRLDEILLGAEGGWTPPLLAVGVLAVDPALVDRAPHLAGWLSQPAPSESSLYRLLNSSLGPELGGRLDDLVSDVAQRGLIVRTLVAVSAPLPPWRPPALPRPTLLDHRWQACDGASESTLFRATFAFAGAPDVALAAVARAVGDGPPESRNEDSYVPSPPGRRGAPRVFGRENDASWRVRSQLTPGAPGSLDRAGILAEQDIPSESGPVEYRFWASDVFGRFGKPVTLTADPPPRPAPPTPVLRHHLVLPADVADLPSTGALSPGIVRLEIVVPALDQLAAGSRPIELISVNGAELGVTAGVFVHDLPLGELPPQGSEDLRLEVFFRDSAATPSATASTTIAVHDRRPLHPLGGAVGLYWTSTPGPSPDVALALTWQTAANAAHRVYLTDQNSLTDSDGQPLRYSEPGEPAPSRAAIADRGSAATSTPRDRFQLLAETVRADGSGTAVLRALLPRSLRTVQFVRIVPLSDQGAEAPFAACGLIAVAVPDDRPPPPPRLEGTVDPETGQVRLEVVADGFDGVALRRDEPGLFTPGAGTDAAPRFRIRRAVARPTPVPGMGPPIPHPAYARPIPGGEGELIRDAQAPASEPVFRGGPEQADVLEPFVRYVYWAEVRMPPERCLLTLPGHVPSAVDVSPLDPADARDRERPSSLPSPPQTIIHLPPQAPAAPTISAVQAAEDATQVVLSLAEPPRAHDAAIGPYRLAMWYARQRRALVPVTEVNGQPLNGTWPVAGTDAITISTPIVGPAVGPATGVGWGGDSVTLKIGYIDPAGRLGALTDTSFFGLALPL